jgi:hypothetical protein
MHEAPIAMVGGCPLDKERRQCRYAFEIAHHSTLISFVPDNLMYFATAAKLVTMGYKINSDGSYEPTVPPSTVNGYGGIF